MRKIGCLGLLLLVGVFSVEVWLYLLVSQRCFDPPDYLIPILVMVGMAVIGLQVVRYHLPRMAQSVLTGQPGRHLIGIVAGALLIFPGFGTDALGIVLLLPGINQLAGRLCNVVAMSVMRHSMKKMFGGIGGSAGGFTFPGMPSGMRPGVPPGMQPDERARFPRPGPKTYDTEAEKD